MDNCDMVYPHNGVPLSSKKIRTADNTDESQNRYAYENYWTQKTVHWAVPFI